MPTKKKAVEEDLSAAPAEGDLLTEEHEAPADGIAKEPLEALADGSEHELVVETREAPPIVRALASFHDLETKRDYKAGDLVPWALERAAHYAARGLVVIEG